jgi:hypothetical protein
LPERRRAVMLSMSAGTVGILLLRSHSRRGPAANENCRHGRPSEPGGAAGLLRQEGD